MEGLKQQSLATLCNAPPIQVIPKWKTGKSFVETGIFHMKEKEQEEEDEQLLIISF